MDPAGDYVTRGDANPHADSTAVPPDTISGVGRVLVPIIGIPLGIANFKLVPVSLMPLGKEIVEKRRGGQFDRAADSVAR